MDRFVMQIGESLVMGDGRTFLVGIVHSGPEGGRFTARRCEVVVAGHAVQIIQIENEEFPEKREPSPKRVFATRDPFILPPHDLAHRECLLREVDSLSPAQ